jgi:hypothetical protein
VKQKGSFSVLFLRKRETLKGLCREMNIFLKFYYNN